MKTTPMKEVLAGTFSALKGEFGYKNVMQAPKIEKIVISSGVGKVDDKQKRKLIEDRLAQITGQKVSPRPAKKSIASFKLREGEVVGYQVTLRGTRMMHFLDRLIHIALPQTRDFRGINLSGIDEMGNLTIGIPEHTIFPETANEEIRDVFGLAITIVSTTKSKKEAEAFFRYIALPLKATGSKKK